MKSHDAVLFSSLPDLIFSHSVTHVQIFSNFIHVSLLSFFPLILPLLSYLLISSLCRLLALPATCNTQASLWTHMGSPFFYTAATWFQVLIYSSNLSAILPYTVNKNADMKVKFIRCVSFLHFLECEPVMLALLAQLES